jgi:hypothetical protein
MQLAELLDRLGYAESPTFLRPQQNAFRIDPDFGHIFRRASETLALQGVYTLRPDMVDHSPSVPIVYVCEADSEKTADKFHRLIWNQDVVPFVLIYTPFGVKLYSGFRHQRRRNGDTAGILQPMMSKHGLLKPIKHLHPRQNYSVCKRNKAISAYTKSASSSIIPTYHSIVVLRMENRCKSIIAF